MTKKRKQTKQAKITIRLDKTTKALLDHQAKLLNKTLSARVLELLEFALLNLKQTNENGKKRKDA